MPTAPHRQVVEQIIGRKLASSEFVHHLNQDHSDNRPENLMILNRRSHAILHANLYGFFDRRTGSFSYSHPIGPDWAYDFYYDAQTFRWFLDKMINKYLDRFRPKKPAKPRRVVSDDDNW